METPKTCLTNHTGSISQHKMPLVINSLREETHTHTHTHTYSHRGQKQFQETSCAPALGQCTSGLKLNEISVKLLCCDSVHASV